MLLKDLICEAINNKQRIKFLYNEKIRVAEPQCCGMSTAGKDVLRAHLTKGGSRPEQLFELNKMQSVEIMDEFFTLPGPNYNPDDSAMKTIYCRL
jgi:hypothetical protein